MATYHSFTLLYTANLMTCWAIQSDLGPCTNLYLQAISYHHTSNKQAVVATQVHRVRAICDHESLHDELQFLRDFQAERLRRAAGPTGSQSTEESGHTPGEALFGRPSSICQHDLQLHQSDAAQVQHYFVKDIVLLSNKIRTFPGEWTMGF